MSKFEKKNSKFGQPIFEKKNIGDSCHTPSFFQSGNERRQVRKLKQSVKLKAVYMEKQLQSASLHLEELGIF